jgi:hypothetical protein
MRNVLASAVLLLAGCSALAPVSSSAEASLFVRDQSRYPFKAGFDGIASVDGTPVAGGPLRSVQLVPGRHTLGYSCPGWFSTDHLPTLSYVFAAGVRYELDCSTEPHVVQVR